MTKLFFWGSQSSGQGSRTPRELPAGLAWKGYVTPKNHECCLAQFPLISLPSPESGTCPDVLPSFRPHGVEGYQTQEVPSFSCWVAVSPRSLRCLWRAVCHPTTLCPANPKSGSGVDLQATPTLIVSAHCGPAQLPSPDTGLGDEFLRADTALLNNGVNPWKRTPPFFLS